MQLATTRGPSSQSAAVDAAGSSSPSSKTSIGGTTDTHHSHLHSLYAYSWSSLYREKPLVSKSLFDLESAVAKRMDLLVRIDALMSSPKTSNVDEVTKKVQDWLMSERKLLQERSMEKKGAVAPGGQSLGVMEDPEAADEDNSPKATVLPPGQFRYKCDMSPEEDLLSHLLCRFAFCINDRWRKWFLSAEEILLRARLRNLHDTRHIVELLAANDLTCRQLTSADDTPKFQLWRASGTGATDARDIREQNCSDYVAVPMTFVLKMIRERRVLCHNGEAFVDRKQVIEVFISLFRSCIARGMHESGLVRASLADTSSQDSDDYRNTLMATLDGLMNHFIVDAVDAVKESAEGTVTLGEVPYLAQAHMPLCMRRIDSHLRLEGHLKHNGRLMYQLFLKGMGLTMEDSMKFFHSLMTVKGGGSGTSVEAFAKSSYGYNIRHNYGKEGKRTEYTSFSCMKIMNMAPNGDRYDCHGCPFRFRDESSLRSLLLKDASSPLGPEFPKVKPTMGDIEDMIKDAKEQHYTRACYKYFMATHTTAKRDTLFRSPLEYYVWSRNIQQEQQKQRGSSSSSTQASSPYGPKGGAPSPASSSIGAKRTMVTLQEGVTRSRTE